MQKFSFKELFGLFDFSHSTGGRDRVERQEILQEILALHANSFH